VGFNAPRKTEAQRAHDGVAHCAASSSSSSYAPGLDAILSPQDWYGLTQTHSSHGLHTCGAQQTKSHTQLCMVAHGGNIVDIGSGVLVPAVITWAR